MLTLKDLLFPRRCPVCDRPVKPAGDLICAECRPKLKYVRQPLCMKCGKQLADSQQEYCADCAHKKHVYDRGISLYQYRSVQNAIYRFKYGGRREYAEFLGGEMAARLGPQILAWKPDALIPVPLHEKRLQKRGYNQAGLLAEEIGRRLGICVLSDWIGREKNTVPLKQLDVPERQNNLKKAFKIRRDDVKLNTIVIIDDIYTTGSTVDEIAAECRRKGVRAIYFAALSAGSGPPR
ncbi:MAG TPA: ComF family protein [Candidatus Eisenbergiella pullicola]|nr:ComF family protein [Candidatus Eisenbergiella pullicola]